MDERRKYRRRPLVVSLEICSRATSATVGKGFIKDLSAEGAALETPRHLRPGDRFLLRFCLPHRREVDVPGEIVYAKDGVLNRAYGARFFDLTTEAKQELNGWLGMNAQRTA